MNVYDIYQFQDNTYILSDPDPYQTEVGDIKQPHIFYPQIKIKKWENESNFSLRLSYDTTGADIIEVDDNIVWKSADGKVEVWFYHILGDSTSITSLTMYEMEVVLNEKPPSNIIEFTIKNKELKWCKQNQLTQDEIDMGCSQPENVINSYAVYHTSKKNNNYTTGKAFHYYRPKIIDDVGTEVWGEPNIDLENEIFTVTIPEEFYNNSVYPIRHAAGATFGYTDVGANTYIGGQNNFVGTSGGPLSTGCESVTSFHIYSYVPLTARNVKGAIYTRGNVGGTNYLVLNSVTSAISITITSPDWVQFNYPSPYQISLIGYADFYLVGSIRENNTLDLYYYYDSGVTADNANISTCSYTTPESSISFAGYDWAISFYITYSGPVDRAIPGNCAINFCDPALT